MEKRIYLVRHGKIEWQKEKAYIGQIDLPLCREGIEQSEKLRNFFAEIPIEKAYSSPLKRCVNTLDIILEGRAIPKMTVDALKEIDMGDWEGKTFVEIKTSDPDAYKKRGLEIDRFSPPNGESFFELQKRVIPAFEKIAGENTTGDIIILGHSGVNRVILSNLLGLPLKDVFKLSLPYGCVCQLNYNPEKEKWTCENR